jgi:hypothetical protein
MAVLGLLMPLVLMSATVPASPLDDQDLLRQAESAFHEGQQGQGLAARAAFVRAAAAYEELLRRGAHNPALYRNLGNACLLADDLPHAILAYRRGLRLTPNDADLHAGLTYARQQVLHAEPARFARPPVEQRPPWLPRITTGLGLALALGLYFLGWVGVTGWLMKRQGWLLLAAGGAFAVVAILAAAFVLEARASRHETEHPLVVVAQDGVQLYKGNGQSYPHFELPLNRGVEARLRFDKGPWLQIELSSGEVGWVRRVDVLIDQP